MNKLRKELIKMLKKKKKIMKTNEGRKKKNQMKI